MNRVTLIGNLTKDIELRATTSGNNVTAFTLAINDKSGKEEQTYFIDCVAWNQQATFLSKYAFKGAKIGVDGKLTTRTYDRKDGTKCKVSEVVTERVELLTPKTSEKESNEESPEEQVNLDESLTFNDDDLPF